MTYPRKRFSQHWLRSEAAIQAILTAAEITPQDRVLEIGPGTGILTHWLLSLAGSVLAVEVDGDRCQQLVHRWGRKDNFLLIQGDFLTQDLGNFPLPRPNKVVANIPYHITGPILEKLLGGIAQPLVPPYELIVLLLQKELAERLCAKPGSSSFGALSVRVQYLANCAIICPVPARAFDPPPKVDSAVVQIRPRSAREFIQDPRQLETLIKLGFANKRKMLRNNLKSLADRDRLTHLLKQLEVSPQARAEDLGVTQWVQLSNTLSGL